MRLAALCLAAALLVSGPSLASPKGRAASPDRRRATIAQREVRFLGLDPHGPLALVKGRKLESPPPAACRRWGPKGSRWSSLDAFGRVVGEVEVVAMERYDVTNCDELALETRSGKPGAGVYASNGYSPLELGPSRATPAERKSLEAIVRARDAALPKARFDEKKRDPALSARMLAFRTPSGEEIAVVGGRGLSVYRIERGAWSTVHEIRPKKTEVGHVDMYRPLAALDMNGDGDVEIVVHERDVDAYADFTLTRARRGYRIVDAGIHGAFA